jgi:SM-20-related protein
MPIGDAMTPDSISEEDILLFEAVIEGLSERGYAVADNFLPKADCKRLLERQLELTKQNQFSRAGIGSGSDFQRNAEIRADKIKWLDASDDNPPTQLLLKRIQSMIDYFNRTCFTGIADFEVHFATYPVGGYYKRHLDQFKGNDHRRFTFILYLNSDWKETEGGALRMYLPTETGETTIDVLPLEGRIVCFRSNEIEHEVLPTFRERHSVTGWWLDRDKIFSFLR